MAEKLLERYATTAFLALLCAVTPWAAFTAEPSIANAMLYHFTHANIFHFLANFAVIARFKPRWTSMPSAYLSATAASLMAFTAVSAPTCGMSAFIFALFGRKDAILGKFAWKLLLINLALGIIPVYNWKIHMMSYLICYTIWNVRKRLTTMSW